LGLFQNCIRRFQRNLALRFAGQSRSICPRHPRSTPVPSPLSTKPLRLLSATLFKLPPTQNGHKSPCYDPARAH
jgi:hypothetical protein